MTEDGLKALIVAELGNIAPDVDASEIDPDEDMREELDIDSMDFLNLVTALHKKLGVNIPESDYAKLSTLNGAVTYLAAKTAAAE